MAVDDDLGKTIDAALASAKPRPLHRVLFNLADCYNQTAALAMSHGSSKANADFSAPAIMCRSFAIELLLKFFIAAAHPTKSKTELASLKVSLHGHPYSVLFDRINIDFQALIARKHTEQAGIPTSPEGFRQLLISTGNQPFVEWRYVYEESHTRYFNMALFSSLADSLGMAAQDVNSEYQERRFALNSSDSPSRKRHPKLHLKFSSPLRLSSRM
jgi:hypothetical protein